ncbi:FecR family protein [Dongia sedimenti]|uniref:FecR family protein n=1 Tax=Dongia sedimenti TaxID=3064282 RepID=A0ABU0YQV1_9PROT|nr:FecR family protein [Rhodospirillaceae bacterium R-7]
MNRRIAEQAADWALRLADGISEPERLDFDAWLRRDPAHGRAFDRARRIMGEAGMALRLDTDFTRRLLRRPEKRGGPTAIVVLLVLAAAGGAFLAADGPLRLRADFVSAAGDMPRIALSDGSYVTLNGESAIAAHFDAGTRSVTLLKGEAYFEVASDPARPFVVTAGPGRIEARGTAFDVNLVGGEVDVTVTEHTVAVKATAAGAETLLASGRRLAYDDQGILRRPEPVPEGFETPWRQGRLIFEDRPLSMVAEEIFRHLPGKVVVADRALAGRRISGSFDLADPEAALASFATAFGLRVAHLGSVLTVIY